MNTKQVIEYLNFLCQCADDYLAKELVGKLDIGYLNTEVCNYVSKLQADNANPMLISDLNKCKIRLGLRLILRRITRFLLWLSGSIGIDPYTELKILLKGESNHLKRRLRGFKANIVEIKSNIDEYNSYNQVHRTA